jgi:hypothetical protein
MSRIFDVMLDAPGPYYVTGAKGDQRFKLDKYGTRGPNQVCLPDFQDDTAVETLIFSKSATGTFVNSELSAPGLRTSEKQMIAHNLDYVAPNVEKVKSSVQQYWELRNHEFVSQVAQFSTPPLTKSNKAIYLLKISATCSRMDFVEIQLGNGDRLSVCGDFVLYSRDLSAMTLMVKMPPKSYLRVSFAQILPQKDTILKLLSRSQYGQGPV